MDEWERHKAETKRLQHAEDKKKLLKAWQKFAPWAEMHKALTTSMAMDAAQCYNERTAERPVSMSFEVVHSRVAILYKEAYDEYIGELSRQGRIRLIEEVKEAQEAKDEDALGIDVSKI